jgi:hypothetical protein
VEDALPSRPGNALWIPAVVIALLSMPMMVTSRTFGHDWTLHLWLIRQQQLNIEAMWHPGLFVSVSRLGVFYPIYAFVGSGLYSVGGVLAIVLGDRPALAYKLLYVVGFCIAYGGMTWLSVQLGLRGWRSQIPGLVFVTGASFIVDLAGRGDLGEFVALAAVPLLVAAGRSLFMSSRVRPSDLLAVVVATFFLTGSNNITLLWAAIFIAFLAIVCIVAFAPSGLPPIPWRRVVVLAGSGAIGAGTNAWFLVDTFRYGRDTLISAQNEQSLPDGGLTRITLLFNPLRPASHSTSPWVRDWRVGLPWMFAAWALVIAVLLWRNREATAKRAFAAVFGVSLVYVVLVMRHGLWKSLPPVLYNVQLTVRLVSWVLMATALLVLLALRWQATAPAAIRRWSTVALVAVSAFNVGAATWQVWRVRSEYVVDDHEVATGSTYADEVVAARYDPPVSWSRGGDFRDVSGTEIATEPSRNLEVPARAIHRSRFAGVLNVPDGTLPFATNIAGGARYVTMTGIRAVGRTSDGLVVAVRAADAPATGPIRVTIQPVRSTVLRLGTIVSIVSGLLLLALTVWVLGGSVAIRRRRPPSPHPGSGGLSAALPRTVERPMELVGSAPTRAR